MWTRRQLKENAKKILSKNYWKAFLVTLVLITITGAGTSGFSSAGSSIGNSFGRSIGKSSNSNTKITTTDNSSDKKGFNGNFDVDIDGKGKVNVKIEDGKIIVNGEEVAGKNGEVKIKGHRALRPAYSRLRMRLLPTKRLIAAATFCFFSHYPPERRSAISPL